MRTWYQEKNRLNENVISFLTREFEKDEFKKAGYIVDTYRSGRRYRSGQEQDSKSLNRDPQDDKIVYIKKGGIKKGSKELSCVSLLVEGRKVGILMYALGNLFYFKEVVDGLPPERQKEIKGILARVRYLSDEFRDEDVGDITTKLA